MTINVVAYGPAYATDLRPAIGGNIALDYGTDDTIFYAWNLTDMTVTVHGGNDTVTTGYGNDTIFDDPAAPIIPAGSKSSGDDVIHAGSGNDTIFAGDGSNTYDGGDGTDTVNYSRATVGINVNLGTGEGTANGHDTYVLIENVIGSDQGDFIFGSSVDNVLKGGKGDDYLSGGDGRDTLFGGDDNDVLAGGKDADTMYGEAGIDTLDYSASNAGVTVDLSRGIGRGGDAEGDSFKYVENITGSTFADTLIGNNGDNVLIGGAGPDVLIGGGGKDTFVFRNAGFSFSDSTLSNPDLIKDFVQGEDKIDLSHLHTGYYGGPPHQLVDQFTGGANEVMVVVSSGSTMVLSDFDGDKVADFAVELSNPIHLTANDFLL